MKPGDFVLSDQFIDFTKVRPVTFYEGVYTIYDETDGKDDLVSEYLKTTGLSILMLRILLQ